MSHSLIKINDRFVNRTSNLSILEQVIFVGSSSTNNYSNSNASGFNASDELFFYDPSPINTISGASLNSSNNWINRFILPAGNYYVQANFGASFASFGQMKYHVSVSSLNASANQGVIGPDKDSTVGSSICSRIVNLSSVATITITVVSSSNVNTVANQGTSISAESWILIRKYA